MQNRTWLRGAVTLGVMGALAAGLLLSPAGAAAPLTKAKAKKIAKKEANKVVDAENAIISQSFADGNVPGTPGFTYDNTTIMGTLTVPAGNWYFHADFQVSRSSSGIIVGCRMNAGGTTDHSGAWVGSSQTTTSVSLQRTASYPSGGTVDVRCDDGTAATTEASFAGLEIVAIEGSSLS